MKKIIDYFKEYGLSITKEKADLLFQYYEYLIDQNKVMNLTAITEYEDVILKHFIDSAIIENLKIDLNGKEIIDIGTGAGFPGLVIAILYPKSKVTLVDSLNKRICFLNRLIEKLNIKNAKCYHSRGEDFAKSNFEKYDIVVSRAVARMNKLLDFTMPLVKKGGMFIAYKGIFEIEEQKEAENKLKKYKAKYKDFYKFDKYGKRTLVIVKKSI